MYEIAINLAKRWEGYLPGPYLCPAGIPTSGYGHAWQGEEKPRPLNREEAEIYLLNDLRLAEKKMLKYSPQMILECEEKKSAIIDFIFNLGPGRYQTSTLRKKVNEGNWEEASYQIQRWVYITNPITKKVERSKGLILRRKAEADLLTLNTLTQEEGEEIC